MAQGKTQHQLFQESWFNNIRDHHHMQNNNNNNKIYTQSSSSSNSSSIGEESTISNGSSLSSFDTTDDATSSTSSSISSNSNGALYDLSEIMAQLPIKRGLSKFYQGKSESFTSLSRVTSIEDLAKKATPYRKKLKASKSCGNGLQSYKSYTLPRAIISKKSKRGVV